jgi:hypothetical protein
VSDFEPAHYTVTPIGMCQVGEAYITCDRCPGVAIGPDGSGAVTLDYIHELIEAHEREAHGG